MKNGKLKLESLKIKSFTTNLSNTETKEIKGGHLSRGRRRGPLRQGGDVRRFFTVGEVRLTNPVVLKEE